MTTHCGLCGQTLIGDDRDTTLCTTCRDEIWRAKCDTDQEAS